MRPFYDILEMIRAHYNNDDDTFNNHARVIIDFYQKDGNIAGVEEILEIMTGKNHEVRIESPKYLKDTIVHNNDNNNENEELINNPLNEIIDRIDNKEDNSNNKNKDSILENEVIPKKRHRRTKKELIASGYYDK